MSKLADILSGSYLLQAKPTINDVIKYTGLENFYRRTGGQQLPQNTVSCMYEHLLLDRFDSLASFTDENQLHYLQLNEVTPLLYTCLKLALAGDPSTNLESLHLIKSLDDFRMEDPAMNILKSTHKVYKAVEMLARLYVLDSLSYPDEAKYWLRYATKLAGQQIDELSYVVDNNTETIAGRKSKTHMKRLQALECAYLIDLGEIDKSQQILKAMIE